MAVNWSAMTMSEAAMLIYKIVPHAEWDRVTDAYQGSAHDRADGFLHFSTRAQLLETLKRHYTGQSGLVLVAVEAQSLGEALKWELAPNRGEDFPHLYGPLSKNAVLRTTPLHCCANGEYLLPPE
jgi:uncharacterized protein (DUF952 family)